MAAGEEVVRCRRCQDLRAEVARRFAVEVLARMPPGSAMAPAGTRPMR